MVTIEENSIHLAPEFDALSLKMTSVLVCDTSMLVALCCQLAVFEMGINAFC